MTDFNSVLTSSDWFNSTKNNKHIFIYSVCGRSRSTLLQRVINSSNEVSIFGEHHYLIDRLCGSLWTMMLINKALDINVDNIELPEYSWMKHIKESNFNFKQSFIHNSHNRWYPNAMEDMSQSIHLVSLSIAELFHPLVEKCQRYGFKEIRLENIDTLNILKWIFPESVFLFVFRSPDTQWNSISQFYKTFDYSRSLGYFCQEYSRLASLYLEFYDNNSDSCIFVGEETLLNLDKLKALLTQLNISSFDTSLLKQSVGSSHSSNSSFGLKRLYKYSKSSFRERTAHFFLKRKNVFSIYEKLRLLELHC